MGQTSWLEIYKALKGYVESKNIKVEYSFSSEDKTFERLKEEFREAFVNEYAGSLIKDAIRWSVEMKNITSKVVESYGLRGVFFSKEFTSFLEDPKSHLKKKIFNYFFELLRGRIDIEEFKRSASAAITTSIRTNMRTTYQNWGFLTILYLLRSKFKARMIYPEVQYLPLERSGRQRSRSIPPNIILRLPDGGSLSFFLEAPRPVSWEDTEDLKRYWGLYTTLRPDLLIYKGEEMDILQLSENPPIKRPDIIVEFKELEDWYLRVREVKGPLARPLSAEEWRFRWLEGLWSGLSEILGVDRGEVKNARKRRGRTIREDKVVVLYKKIYDPKTMVLISRSKLPREIREYLESEDIRVLDSVGFRAEKLASVVEELSETAGESKDRRTIEIPTKTYKLLLEASEKLGLSVEETLERALFNLISGGRNL